MRMGLWRLLLGVELVVEVMKGGRGFYGLAAMFVKMVYILGKCFG